MFPVRRNVPGPTADFLHVTCSDVREATSAHLDGEPAGVDLSALHRHLDEVRGLRVVTRIVVALAAGLLGLVGTAAPAAAPAVPERSDPAPRALLDAGPRGVTLTYDEAVTTLPTSVRVYGPDGSRVDDRHVLHPAGEGRRVPVGLQDNLARGSYLVSWRVISADSHPVAGAFTFAVGQRTATPTAHADDTDT